MKDNKYYAKVAQEIENNQLDPACWARALEEARGITVEARGKYIKLRVTQMKASDNATNRTRVLNKTKNVAKIAVKGTAFTAIYFFQYLISLFFSHGFIWIGSIGVIICTLSFLSETKDQIKRYPVDTWIHLQKDNGYIFTMILILFFTIISAVVIKFGFKKKRKHKARFSLR
tara:strand:+ start:930 stop:1448 length:519 start_codon:yes stop_codon:yes gene_type:complete